MQDSHDQNVHGFVSVIDHVVADQRESESRPNLITGFAEFRVVANDAKLLGHAERTFRAAARLSRAMYLRIDLMSSRANGETVYLGITRSVTQ